MNDDKLLETIAQFEVPKGYRMWAHEPLLIWNGVKGDWFFAITYAFSYGFLKGQRAAKNEAKRKKEGRI